jgi:hypothetical protein
MESADSSPDLLAAYTATLETKAPGTVDVYTRILRQFTARVSRHLLRKDI